MIVAAGSQDVSVPIRIVDSTDGSPEEGVTSATGGLALWYWRIGGTVVALTESDLAAIDSVHADGGMKHAANGYYRVDIPDAAFLTGAPWVLVGGTATGMFVISHYVQIMSATRGLAGTALPDAAADAAGGLPVSDAGGLAMDTLVGDALAAVALDHVVAHHGTAQAGAATSITLAAGASGVAGSYVGSIVILVNGTGAGQLRVITAYNEATKVATVATWTVNPDATSVYIVLPVARTIVAAMNDGVLTNAAIANTAIQSEKIGSSAFTAAKFATGAFTAAKFAADYLAAVNAEVDAALADYDPPTKAELDAAAALLATPAQVLAQAGAALASYDPPTKAELDTAVTTIRGADGDTLKTLSDQIDDVATLGAGALTLTYTLTSSVDGLPISEAEVWVTTDVAGSNVVASGVTNTSGVVTFHLDAGTYYVWRSKAGWTFVNPDTEVVA